jgi:hypothetical protein
MKSLFKITEKGLQLSLALEEEELTPELNQELLIAQDELIETAFDRVNSIRMNRSDIDFIDIEIKRLTDLKRRKTRSNERMEESLVFAMGIYNMEKISSPTMNLSLRRSESVEVDLTEALPDDFKITKTTVTPDKVAIKQAIKQGENITGATLKVNYSLQIK